MSGASEFYSAKSSIRLTVVAAALCFGLFGCAQHERVNALTQSSPASVWGPEVQLSYGNNGGGDIAAQGDFVHVIFGKNPLWYRRSTDGGETFSAPTVIAGSAVRHETDSIKTDGDNVYVLYTSGIRHITDWCCDRDLGDLYLLRSENAGLTWGRPLRLTNTRSAYRQSIAAAGGIVHIVWCEFRAGAWEIFYRQSADGGASWTPAQRLAAAVFEGPIRPQVAIQGDNVHVTWSDDRDGNGRCYTMVHCAETYYTGSHDGGATWGPQVRLTFGPRENSLAAFRSDIAAASDGSVIVAYDQDLSFGSSGVQFVRRSPDQGRSWLPPVQVAPNTVPEQTHPAAMANGATIVISWFDRRDPNNEEIYAALSFDSGRTWAPEERVSMAEGASSTPHVALTDRFLHVAWLDGRNGGSELFYRRRALVFSELAGGLAGASSIETLGSSIGPAMSARSIPMSTPGGRGLNLNTQIIVLSAAY